MARKGCHKAHHTSRLFATGENGYFTHPGFGSSLRLVDERELARLATATGALTLKPPWIGLNDRHRYDVQSTNEMNLFFKKREKILFLLWPYLRLLESIFSDRLWKLNPWQRCAQELDLIA